MDRRWIRKLSSFMGMVVTGGEGRMPSLPEKSSLSEMAKTAKVPRLPRKPRMLWISGIPRTPAILSLTPLSVFFQSLSRGAVASGGNWGFGFSLTCQRKRKFLRAVVWFFLKRRMSL